MKAFDRASRLPAEKQQAMVKRHKISIDHSQSPSSQHDLTVSVRGSGEVDKGDLEHELIHREQFRRAKGRASLAQRHYARTTSKYGEVMTPTGGVNDKAFDVYLAHPYEIMASAYDVARELKAKFGNKALEKAKEGAWWWSSDHGAVLRSSRTYAAGTPQRRKFLKYLAAYLGEARAIIEAESPKRAMQAGFGRGPRYVTIDDADVRWVRSGNPDYPDHWQAMWTNPFTIAHRSKLKGCPLGSSFEAGERGRWLALNDLVNRTNRESDTNFSVRIPGRNERG